MSLNILADRKNALIFAGGVVACATLATANMGSQYSPDSEEERAQSVASAQEDRPSRASKASRSVAYNSESDSVFGSYGEDDAGYEDTMGEDPDFGSDSSDESSSAQRPAKPVMRPATAAIRPVGPGAGSANPLQTVMDGETSPRSPKKGRKASGS